MQASLAQKSEINFDILFGEETIGSLKAARDRHGKKTIQNVKTSSETKVFMMSIQMESEIFVTKESGELIEGTAFRRASGASEIRSHMKKIGDKTYQRDRNGETTKLENTKITLCVVDLYFTEPKGKTTTVFSNVHGEFLEVKQLSTGKYELITPDNNNSVYTYVNGKLVMIEVDTPVGKVVTKRK